MQADLNIHCYNDYLHIVSIALFWAGPRGAIGRTPDS